MIAESVFWGAIGLTGYVYVGYPIVLLAMRQVIRRPINKKFYQPSVSLLVTAYNEAEVIRQKIENSLQLDYPKDLLEIVVASDGSTDSTAAIAQVFADGRHVRVLAYPVNRGKILAMNETLPHLVGSIVIFSDASAMLMPNAVREIVENFNDPSIGAVSGVYQVKATEKSSLGGSEELYWKYETYLRLQESALDSLLGGHGHLYGIRKELYTFLPAGTINDDYVIPVRIVARGYRAVYEPKAIGWEEAAEMAGFGRRVRIMTGNVQQLRELPRLLGRPLPLFFFLSHKLGRLVVPFAMVAALISSAALIGDQLYARLFGLQIVLYLLALAGAVAPLKPKALRLPYYFTMINAATFWGIYHALHGGRKMAWK